MCSKFSSVVAIRVWGSTIEDCLKLAEFSRQMNIDYKVQSRPNYLPGSSFKYNYYSLNCAQCINLAFHVIGWQDIPVPNEAVVSRLVKAAFDSTATPMRTALALMEACDARGYGLDIVVFKKIPGSTFASEIGKDYFGDLPNRFPAVVSLDFANAPSEYESYDNIFNMYLFYGLTRCRIGVKEQDELLTDWLYVDNEEKNVSMADIQARLKVKHEFILYQQFTRISNNRDTKRACTRH